MKFYYSETTWTRFFPSWSWSSSLSAPGRFSGNPDCILYFGFVHLCVSCFCICLWNPAASSKPLELENSMSYTWRILVKNVWDILAQLPRRSIEILWHLTRPSGLVKCQRISILLLGNCARISHTPQFTLYSQALLLMKLRRVKLQHMVLIKPHKVVKTLPPPTPLPISTPTH